MTDARPQHFAGDKAAAYDRARAPLASIYKALYQCTNAVLSSLGDASRVLCVGAGTGDELVSLAQSHPAWTFAVVEPSPDMMALCREKARSAGIDMRCEFFDGRVEDVPASESFDAATCLLVSYFILDPAERDELFSAIAARLRTGGVLVNAELAPGTSSPEYQLLCDAWVAMHQAVGIRMKPDYLGRDVVVTPAEEVDAMLVRTGFVAPVRFFQTLLISAWCAEKQPSQGAGTQAAGG